jgi:hypothetical protein
MIGATIPGAFLMHVKKSARERGRGGADYGKSRLSRSLFRAPAADRPAADRLADVTKL